MNLTISSSVLMQFHIRLAEFYFSHFLRILNVLLAYRYVTYFNIVIDAKIYVYGKSFNPHKIKLLAVMHKLRVHQKRKIMDYV
jgi:hypothetical protein